MSGTLLLLFALEPGSLSVLFRGLGVDPQAARLATAQFSVMMALTGAGVLVIGLTWWARVGRMRASWLAHSELLQQIAGPLDASVQILIPSGVGFSAEVDGLRLEVVLEPQRHGATYVRARCSAEIPLDIVPLGMGPASPPFGWGRVADGDTWEMWALQMMDDSGPRVTSSLRGALDALFGAGGARRMRHDSGGIEVQLPHASDLDVRDRLPMGIDGVVALARANH